MNDNEVKDYQLPFNIHIVEEALGIWDEYSCRTHHLDARPRIIDASY